MFMVKVLCIIIFACFCYDWGPHNPGQHSHQDDTPVDRALQDQCPNVPADGAVHEYPVAPTLVCHKHFYSQDKILNRR